MATLNDQTLMMFYADVYEKISYTSILFIYVMLLLLL